MSTVKIRAIGNSQGVTLPKALLEHFHLSEGDEVQILQTQDGILIAPYDETLARGLEAYAIGAKKYRNAMRELAK